MKTFEINKKLLPMKAHYFLWNGGTGPVTPYLSSYAKQLGFSSVIVGFIYTILPISGMLAKPLFGSIADRFHCQKTLFLAAQLLTAVAFLSVLYAPKVDVSQQVQLTCTNNKTVFKTNTTKNECSLDEIRKKNTFGKCTFTCKINDELLKILCDDWDYCGKDYDKTLVISTKISKNETESANSTVTFHIHEAIVNGFLIMDPKCTNFLTTCDIKCDDYQINDVLPEPSIDDSKAYGMYQFWVLLFLMVVGWVGQAIAVSIGDAICFELLGDKPSSYGYQRMYGSLGWGLIAALAGVLIDISSQGTSYKNYTIAFYMAAVFLVLDFIASSQIKYTQKKVSTNIFRDVCQLLLDIKVIVFLIWCIGMGMCTAMIWQFLFWLIEELAAAKGCTSMAYVKTLEGLVQAVQCLCGEAPFFFISGKIMKKIGHINTMSLVLFVVGIRFCLYSVITNPWYFLPIELTNGLTFGLFFACMASYASIIAPSGTEATMQGLVGSVFEGIGVSAGSALGGTLLKLRGGALTFRYFGFGAFALCFLHIAVQQLIKVKRSEYVKPEDSSKKSDLDDEKELTYLYS